MSPDIEEGIITVVSYNLDKYPKSASLQFCIDTNEMYDFILIVNRTPDGTIKTMTKYGLMGNSEKYGKVYQWKDGNWEMTDYSADPIYHDIRDMYSLVCKYQENNWKVKLK